MWNLGERYIGTRVTVLTTSCLKLCQNKISHQKLHDPIFLLQTACTSVGKPDLQDLPSFFPCLQIWVLGVSLLDNVIGGIPDICNSTPTSDSVILLYIPLISRFQSGFMRHMHQNYLGMLTKSAEFQAHLRPTELESLLL